ncbi:hypothetical protein SAMN04488548_1271, partial [Gordonia westfalica]
YADAVAELAAMRKDLANGILPNAGQITVRPVAGLLGGHDRRATPETPHPRHLPVHHQTPTHPACRVEEAGKLTPTDVRRMVNHVADAHTTRTAQAAYSVLAKALGMQ